LEGGGKEGGGGQGGGRIEADYFPPLFSSHITEKGRRKKKDTKGRDRLSVPFHQFLQFKRKGGSEGPVLDRFLESDSGERKEKNVKKGGGLRCRPTSIVRGGGGKEIVAKKRGRL